MKSKGAASSDDLTANHITGAALRFSHDRSAKAGLQSKVLRGKLKLVLDSPETESSDDDDDNNGNG